MQCLQTAELHIGILQQFASWWNVVQERLLRVDSYQCQQATMAHRTQTCAGFNRHLAACDKRLSGLFVEVAASLKLSTDNMSGKTPQDMSLSCMLVMLCDAAHPLMRFPGARFPNAA